MIKRRKKTCPKCNSYLWLRDFYKCKDGYSPYCKTCTREMKREEYARNRKKPDRIYKDHASGMLKEHKGYSTKIFWSEYMIERLRRKFATTKNEDLAIDIGVSVRTIVRKARELGLQKDKQWMLLHSRRCCKLMHIINRCCGNSGQFKKGKHASPATEYKKKTTKISRL